MIATVHKPSSLSRAVVKGPRVSLSRRAIKQPCTEVGGPTALVGIDLGTSNSTVACLEGGRATVVPGKNGHRSTPSVISLSAEDARFGKDAQAVSGCQGWDTFRSVKRLVGQSYAEAAAQLQEIPSETRQTPDGRLGLWSASRQQQLLSPEALLSGLLRHLVTQATLYLGQPVDGGVVTVPAEFGEPERQVVRQAACLAGLPNVQLLQEPIAAALAYGAGGSDRDELVLVFDLGGGTLDVSLLDSFEGALEVLDTDGDALLGGNDFDAALARWLLPRHMLNEQSASLRGNPAAWASLLQASEAAKIALSSHAEAELMLQLPGARPVQIELTQDDLEEATWGLRPRLWGPLARVGNRACVQWHQQPAGTEQQMSARGLRKAAAQGRQPSHGRDYAPPPRKITQLVLVGGSSRIPWVQDFVRKAAGVAPSSGIDPEECVAVGAALYAGMLAGEVQGVELADGAYSLDLHGRASGFGAA